MATGGLLGGFSSGMAPWMQGMMYAQALRNSGATNPETGAPYNADQPGGFGSWLGRQLGFTRAPYTQANPYVPSAANGGIAPATPGAGGNYLQGFQAYMPQGTPAPVAPVAAAPLRQHVGTGTTQGYPAAQPLMPTAQQSAMLHFVREGNQGMPFSTAAPSAPNYQFSPMTQFGQMNMRGSPWSANYGV